MSSSSSQRIRYRMIPTKDDAMGVNTEIEAVETDLNTEPTGERSGNRTRLRDRFRRETYDFSLAFVE